MAKKKTKTIRVLQDAHGRTHELSATDAAFFMKSQPGQFKDVTFKAAKAEVSEEVQAVVNSTDPDANTAGETNPDANTTGS